MHFYAFPVKSENFLSSISEKVLNTTTYKSMLPCLTVGLKLYGANANGSERPYLPEISPFHFLTDRIAVIFSKMAQYKDFMLNKVFRFRYILRTADFFKITALNSVRG